jgi:hypothetical protein
VRTNERTRYSDVGKEFTFQSPCDRKLKELDEQFAADLLLEADHSPRGSMP